jgi:hypothetical protein
MGGVQSPLLGTIAIKSFTKRRKIMKKLAMVVVLLLAVLLIRSGMLDRTSKEVANHVAQYNELDEWCEGFAMLRYGDRTDGTEWMATKSLFSTNNIWTVGCWVEISEVGRKSRSELIMTMLYDEDEGYLYFQSMSMEHLRMLSLGGFNIKDILGQPKIYAPMD